MAKNNSTFYRYSLSIMSILNSSINIVKQYFLPDSW